MRRYLTLLLSLPGLAFAGSGLPLTLHDAESLWREHSRELKLADLSSVALRKLGAQCKQLIDTEKDRYPATRQWAQAIHRQCPQAQGLCWISRQDDTARAVVLFGDRIPAEALRPGGGSRSLLDDGEACDAVLDLADRIGVHVVPGH